MKKLGFFILALLVCGVGFSQGGYVVDGKSGIKGRMDPSGKYLSVINCRTGSPADISGIGYGDRIYRINGKEVAAISAPGELLKKLPDKSVSLDVIKRGSSDLINLAVPRLNIDMEAVKCYSEAELFRTQELKQRRRTDSVGMDMVIKYMRTEPKGPSYSASRVGNYFYIYYNLIGDLVNTSTIAALKDVSRDFSAYRTFDFDYSSKEDPLLERNLFSQLEAELRMAGLRRDQEKPDLLILINFYSGVQSQYIPPQQIVSTKIKSVFNWYWGYIPVPVTESKVKEGYNITHYLTNISLKFLDAREIETSKTPPVVWSGSLSRSSRGQSHLNEVGSEYMRILMCQYPEVWRENAKSYLINKYAYTGIIFGSGTETSVADVIPGSPSDIAGLQKGDVITHIVMIGQNGAKDNSSFYSKNQIINPKMFYINGFTKFNNSWEGYFAPVDNLFADFDFSSGAKVLMKVKRGKSKLEFELVPEMKEVLFLDDVGRHW
ncbi:MAG: hypothetical protein CVT93_09595 [Bacteroidetes bacterium HGW-Bacteroidetes-10]|nr:MAG: hypothetical protein CVT93_09595 [Bacteroidetes bacterium HGW-Bacteroidetes-10]